MITLGKRSLEQLEGVHPDLVRVVHRAATMAPPEADFSVLEGVRTREKMCINWGKGRTPAECEAHGVPAIFSRPADKKVTWLSNPFASNHAVKADGYGHAVDLVPFPLDWNDLARFKAIGALMLSAAHQEHVSIVWGGNWRKSPDWPHFELVQ